jgi:hypothetical protein
MPPQLQSARIFPARRLQALPGATGRSRPQILWQGCRVGATSGTPAADRVVHANRKSSDLPHLRKVQKILLAGCVLPEPARNFRSSGNVPRRVTNVAVNAADEIARNYDGGGDQRRNVICLDQLCPCLPSHSDGVLSLSFFSEKVGAFRLIKESGLGLVR